MDKVADGDTAKERSRMPPTTRYDLLHGIYGSRMVRVRFEGPPQYPMHLIFKLHDHRLTRIRNACSRVLRVSNRVAIVRFQSWEAQRSPYWHNADFLKCPRKHRRRESDAVRDCGLRFAQIDRINMCPAISEMGMMLENCELRSRGVQILHRRGERMQNSRTSLVPADRLIEELRPTLSSVLVSRSRPSPREEGRHA